MEQTHKITEKQLLFLDVFLSKKGIYSNDKIELTDHLISEFETCGNNNLSQYLSNNLSFIRNYSSRKKNAIFVRDKKKVWKQLIRFYTDIKVLPISISITTSLFFLSKNVDVKTREIVFFVSMIVLIIYGFVLTFHRNKKIRKIIEFKNLFQSLSLSHIFLYMFPAISSFLTNNYLVFFFYWFFALGINIAGIVAVKTERKEILEKHKHLLN